MGICKNKTDQSREEIVKLIQHLEEVSRYSESLFWIASPDFKRSYYISSVLESTYGIPRAPLFKDLKYLDQFIHPHDLKNHHPFINFAKRVREEGPQAKLNETVRIIRPDGRLVVAVEQGHPVFNKNEQCIAITGIATNITPHKLVTQLPIHSLTAFPEENKKKYFLRGKYKNIYLTKREAECAFFMLQGKTTKKIAMILQLSPRSVEDVFVRIKGKLGLQYRSDLIEVLIDSGFIMSLS
jgi:DNA-binding CsgD family transcriptional regulator